MLFIVYLTGIKHKNTRSKHSGRLEAGLIIVGLLSAPFDPWLACKKQYIIIVVFVTVVGAGFCMACQEDHVFSRARKHVTCSLRDGLSTSGRVSTTLPSYENVVLYFSTRNNPFLGVTSSRNVKWRDGVNRSRYWALWCRAWIAFTSDEDRAADRSERVPDQEDPGSDLWAAPKQKNAQGLGMKRINETKNIPQVYFPVSDFLPPKLQRREQRPH